MHLIFVGQGYPKKLFNLEHFLTYGVTLHNPLYQPFFCKLQSTMMLQFTPNHELYAAMVKTTDYLVIDIISGVGIKKGT